MLEILGNRRFLEIPGEGSYELPPLLLKNVDTGSGLDEIVGNAETIVESESMIPDTLGAFDDPSGFVSQQRLGLAINLTEQYVKFVKHWTWGESVLEWIRQCETTFQTQPNLRALLRPDVWPHAGRSSFVTLLEDKHVPVDDIDIENAMGYRLTFRQPPPIEFLSDKFLFFLNSSLAASAYQTWAEASGEELPSLPPERFQFFVMTDSIREV
jgi:hypothetical protein